MPDSSNTPREQPQIDARANLLFFLGTLAAEMRAAERKAIPDALPTPKRY